MTESADFQIELEVRDYELDLQGIVNNSVYLNYLEHARHRYLEHLGLDFSELHKEGIDAVVTRIELDYISSLSSGDNFVVTVHPGRKGRLRLLFYQNIVKLPDRKPIVRGIVTATCLCDGRPRIPEIVEKAIAPFIKPRNT